jgi:hypothetical protein
MRSALSTWFRAGLALAALPLIAACDQFHPVETYWTETQAAAVCPDDEVVYVFMHSHGVGYLRRGHWQWGGGGGMASHNFEYGCRNALEQIGVTCGGWTETPAEFPGIVSLSPSCFWDWKPKASPASSRAPVSLALLGGQ